MSADVVFLEGKGPLAAQVARTVLRGAKSGLLDLGDTQIWIPTAGAGRRIRFALAQAAAERKTGVLSPTFLQPMEALLPEDPPLPLATRAEREMAWALVLRESPEEDLGALIPRSAATLASPAAWLGVAGQLCDLGDLLVEGGHSPLSPAVAAVCGEEDAPRWTQLAALYEKVLARLQAAGRLDPNAARLQTLDRPAPRKNLRRIFVACIPDLTTAAARYLAAVAKLGVRVQLLVWRPADLAAGWDEWGRPLPKEWAEATIPIAPDQIQIAREAADEAALALDFLSAAPEKGNFALALADESLATTFAAEVARREGVPFLPGGKKLATCEAAVVALEWETLRRQDELRGLRNLLQQPRFARWLCGRAGLGASQLQAACDFLITEPLAETLEEAEAFLASPELPKKPRELENPLRALSATLLAALREVGHFSFAEVLREAWAGAREPTEREEVAHVLQLHRELGASPLFHDWEAALDPAFARSLRAAQTFEAAPDGALELSGWLETPWIEADRLALCGCIEGSLPTSVNEHAFLPDSRRAALGLQDNAGRFARDACLLSCLIARHGAENSQLSFSKFGADGSPALPSRLLLRSAAEALPERVVQMFSAGKKVQVQPPRKNGWRWTFPEKLLRREITRISPTGFKEYLACPFRFYWKQVLRLDENEPDPREMDARTFGQLVHSTLEAYADVARDETRADLIEKAVLEQFARETLRLFGSRPAPAVRVQLESMKVRLRAFAQIQARERADGWEIIDVEKKFPVENTPALKLAGLDLSAQIDRIERHPDLGLRIMDYKTFSTFKEPEKSHFRSAPADLFLTEARVERGGKEKAWIDLQLPLYRYIAANHYPDATIQTAYFVLPADPGQTAIAPFDLGDEDYRSALACARAIAERVQRGVFWPPQPVAGNWGDPCSALFLNGRPEDSLDPETIAFLKGRP